LDPVAPKKAAARQKATAPQAVDSPQMFSIVATVADPSHTHLALFLDQQTEAIERSVQARGWTFTGQWLPWVDRFDGNEPNIGTRRSQRWLQREQEELPGILVFRSTLPGRIAALFVFLVPETVTGGINGPAFYAAMHLAKVLSSGRHKVGVLAPSFSGSLASLSDLLNTMQKAGTAPPISSTVYGVVSNRSSASTFVKATSPYFPTGLDFHSGVLDSKDYQLAFCTVLRRYGVDGERAALFKEDEGGLEKSIRPDPPEIGEPDDTIPCLSKLETYVFPREISHLRNAYQDTAGAVVKDPYLDQPGRINFSIRDPNSGEDSVPAFSETQTPLTQDTILSSITDELNRRHTHVVFISVTNALDALFLVQALRTACPDTRVFVEGPNALFIAAAARQALTGTLFLSPYPMFFEGDDWLECTKDKAAGTCEEARLSERLMFPDSNVQGAYNVTQLLLTDMKAGTPVEKLRGYRQPGESYPGVWVLTLNRFGFLPVDLFSEKLSPVDGNQPQEADWFKHATAKATTLPTVLDPLSAPRPWMLTVLVVSIAILLACLTFVLCNKDKWSKPSWLVLSDPYASRFEALLCAGLSLTALEWFLALPFCLPWRPMFVFASWRVALLGLAILLGLLAPLGTLAPMVIKLRDPLKAEFNWRSPDTLYYATPIVLFFFTVIDWFHLCNRPDTGLFFRFRALELYSGSSPALPLVLACLAFFSISLSHLKQYALAGLGRPRLRIEQPDPPASPSGYFDKFRGLYCSIRQRISAPWTLEAPSWRERGMVALVFPLVYFVILGLSSTNAFELPWYNWLLLAAIVAILLCLATKWYDLLALWEGVRELLKLIQVLPLEPAIKRISRRWPKRSIWAFNRSVSMEAVQREMLYALHRRFLIRKQEELPKTMTAAVGGVDSAPLPESTPRTTAAQAYNDSIHLQALIYDVEETTPQETKPQPPPSVHPTAGQKVSAVAKLGKLDAYQTYTAKLALRILHEDLIPAWQRSLNYEQGPVRELNKPLEEYAPESLPQKYAENCADFVALQYCGFIAYAVGQVKRMATAVSVIFVLLALLFNSYSPEGSQLVGRFLVVLFIVIGFAIWRVFSQMERNTILSIVAHTAPGKLSGEFWLQLLAVGGLPLLGVLGHLFPAVSQFLFQWIAPSVQAAH
jgi:hypothetical protein